MTREPSRRMMLAFDMERYSRKDNDAQHRAQRTFQDVLRAAADEIGLGRERWRLQHSGDGELAILPADVSERAVVGELVPVLDRLLAGEAGEPVRLRVAIHEGPVHLDGASGFAGEAVVAVCRMVDAPELKDALRRYRRANVALIVSDQVYRQVVVPYGRPAPDRFARTAVTIPEKAFAAEAWIFVPGEDVTTAAGRTARETEAAGTWTIGSVHAGTAVFGNGNTTYNLGSKPDDH